MSDPSFEEIKLWADILKKGAAREDYFNIIDKDIFPLFPDAAKKLLEFEDISKTEIIAIIQKVKLLAPEAAALFLTSERFKDDINKDELKFMIANIPSAANLAAKKMMDTQLLSNNDLKLIIEFIKDVDILNDAVTVFFMKEGLTKKDLIFIIEKVDILSERAAITLLSRRDVIREDYFYVIKNIKNISFQNQAAEMLMADFVLSNQELCFIIRYCPDKRLACSTQILGRQNTIFDLFTIVCFVPSLKESAVRIIIANFRNLMGKRAETTLMIGICKLLKDYLNDFKSEQEKEEAAMILLDLINRQISNRKEPPYVLTKEASIYLVTIMSCILSLNPTE